jgi:MoaA/NifB/PqqE/SkfB family radical SAM enzyme
VYRGTAPERRPTTPVRCWEIAREQRIPLKCKLNVTYRCNLACSFCYNGERPGPVSGHPSREELRPAEIEQLLGQLKDSGTFVLTITGGEPFCRDDVLDIVASACDRGFAVEILTNGTRVTPDAARRLADLGVQLVVIPIFGARASTHDTFVRVDGAFERAVLGIRRLRSAGVQVGVRCAVMRQNFDQWSEVRDLVKELGARYFPHVQVHLPVDGRRDLRDERLDAQQLAQLFEAGLQLNPEYRCGLGFARVDVLPNGDVTPCALVSLPVGNVRQTPFGQIWRESPGLEQLRAQLQNGSPECSGCSTGETYRCSIDALYDDGGLDRSSSFGTQVARAAASSARADGQP